MPGAGLGKGSLGILQAFLAFTSEWDSQATQSQCLQGQQLAHAFSLFFNPLS